ncbi:MAG: hypothetical protein FWF44_10585 [Defluviitaleaceae bacterium]|nr:hypothetical protein [Defluviitaleaceae bacterium]
MIGSGRKKSFYTAAALAMAAFAAVWCLMPGKTAYANDINVAGDAAGRVTITGDTKLFDVTGMMPGDSASSTITVTNNDTVDQGFDILMAADNILARDGRKDLAEALDLVVTAQGFGEVFNGKLMAFNSQWGPVSLGSLAGGASVTLTFDLTLDGAATGNDFQRAEAEFQVTLIFNSYGAPAVSPSPLPRPSPSRPPVIPPSPSYGPAPSGYTPPSPVIQTVPPVPTEIIPEIVIPEETAPLGTPGPAEETPRSTLEPVLPSPGEPQMEQAAEMPKTGEPSLGTYLIPGAALIMLGAMLILLAIRNRASRENR